MITGDTITDEQIREMRDELQARRDRGSNSREDNRRIVLCGVALGGVSASIQRNEARSRCAKILNAKMVIP